MKRPLKRALSRVSLALDSMQLLTAHNAGIQAWPLMVRGNVSYESCEKWGSESDHANVWFKATMPSGSTS